MSYWKVVTQNAHHPVLKRAEGQKIAAMISQQCEDEKKFWCLKKLSDGY
jgi:hypothetical protein